MPLERLHSGRLGRSTPVPRLGRVGGLSTHVFAYKYMGRESTKDEAAEEEQKSREKKKIEEEREREQEKNRGKKGIEREKREVKNRDREERTERRKT